ncbi:glycerophosphodiester phosphodiesterase [Bacillus sp. V3B]|uniref:glycerophosphodiester phosphodiesterase n=1 Tax=Bacillus sp. V3B TaxID=2804915 RepID=UPI00210921C7|nr:glycerophosphodiester phosphodiesterase [Bacillus sp. V3B]MCQ6273758.1 glycerophosphodiester phosphodiesterase [Bacillus sp. V3B]
MTLIFAHRGYSALYPENTMLAFRKAEEAGADGIELDVQLSKDGEVVVIHDEKVNRTTNGSGFVTDLTFKELKRLNAGYNVKTNIKKQTIPSLREVLEWMTTNRITCNIELKNGVFRYQGMEEKVVQLIREYELSHRIILSSFNHYSIVHCYRIASEIEMAPLIGQGMYMPWVYAEAIQAKGIHPKFKAITDEVVKQSLEQGVAVRPYTINSEKDMVHAFKLGCTAFMTDDPIRALRLRERMFKDHTR